MPVRKPPWQIVPCEWQKAGTILKRQRETPRLELSSRNSPFSERVAGTMLSWMYFSISASLIDEASSRRNRDGSRAMRARTISERAEARTFSSSSIKAAGFGRRKARRDPLLMRLHQPREPRQRLLAVGREAERMGAPVARRGAAHQKAARLQAVQDRHQGRAVDAERPGQRHLAEARIALDQHQQAEFARRQRLARLGEGAGEVGEHRRLGAPQHIAQQRRQHAAIESLSPVDGPWASGKRRLFGDQTNSQSVTSP